MLKQKVDSGADYIVTQMFFDNGDFFKFVKECRQSGITIPIIPGLKILTGVRQLTSLAKNFNVNLPDALVDEVHENPKHVKEIGIKWTAKQVTGLFNDGVMCAHCYIMNDVKAALRVFDLL